MPETTVLIVRIVLGAAVCGDFFLRGYFGRHRGGDEKPRASKSGRGPSVSAALMVLAGALYYLSLLVFVAWPQALRFAQLAVLPVLSVIGMVMLAAGLLLVAWSHRALGSSFSGGVAPVAGQPLVTHGPYARVRHPLYLAQLVMAAGVALSTANLVHAGVWAVCGVVLIPRARMEDRTLGETYGDAWGEFAAHTGLIWPRWR